MATITEQRNSRAGGLRGVFGYSNQVRVFHVETDAGTDDPTVTIQDGALANFVTIGSPHPNLNGLNCVALGRGNRLAPKLFEVVAYYGTPLQFPTANAFWDYELYGGAETETRLTDIDGQKYGYPAFERFPLDTSPADGSPVYTATTPNGKTGLVLRGGADAPFYSRPRQALRRGGNVVFWRYFPNNPDGGNVLLNSTGTVNAEDLRVTVGSSHRRPVTRLFGGRYHFLFTDVRIAPQQGVLLQQSEVGKIWKVTATFRFSVVPLYPRKEVVQFVDEEAATESPVRDAQLAYFEREYKDADLVSHSSVMGALH